MKAEDFKYEPTQQFVTDTENIDKFYMESYAKPAITKEEYEKRVDDTVSMPLQIFNFPWNEEFVGLVVQVGRVNIREKEEEGVAELAYEYRVIANPNKLDLAEDSQESRDNPDNELLDTFIGRVIEALLYRMSQDKEFLEKIEKEQKEQVEEPVDQQD